MHSTQDEKGKSTGVTFLHDSKMYILLSRAAEVTCRSAMHRQGPFMYSSAAAGAHRPRLPYINCGRGLTSRPLPHA